MYFDTAYTFKFIEKELMADFIEIQGEEWVLFGTDFPLVDQKDDIEYLNSLDLPQESKSKILSQNAKKLFKL
jgi:predicted TIM-barrel fold metal-dependent hydrolase